MKAALSSRAARSWPLSSRRRAMAGSRPRPNGPSVSRCRPAGTCLQGDNMIDVQEEKNIYLSNFARFEKGLAADGHSSLPWLPPAALKRFTELGFPTTRNEDWKFTNVAPLAKLPFKLAAQDPSDLT